MSNYNKIVEKIIESAYRAHLRAGHFKDVKWSDGNGSFSCLLFEYATHEKLYYYAANHFISTMLAEPHGVFSRKRSENFFNRLVSHLALPVLGVNDLAVGDRVKLVATPTISKKYREGTIGSIDLLQFSNIVDLIDCVEEHGYQDTYGSAYSNEVVLVLRDGVWRIFEGEGEAIITYPF